MELTPLLITMSLLSAGMLAAGLIAGYLRGIHRGQQRAPSSQLDRLAGVGRAILSAQLRLDALCEVVYQQATRIVDTRNFQIGLFDGDDYAIKVWLREGERQPANIFNGAANTGIIGWVRQTSQSLRVGDYERDWDTLPAKPAYESVNPPRSAIFTPLIAGGTVIGIIIVQSDDSDTFNEEHLRLLSVLSSQAAGAIHNAQLYRQAHERLDQLRVISEVGQQITAVQSLPSLFRQIVTLVNNTFHYYAVSIFTYDPFINEIKLRASSHEEFGRRNLILKPGEGLIGSAHAEAKTVNSPDVASDPRYLPVAVLDQTKSEICVPLIVEKRVLGILDFQSERKSAFNTEDVFALESLAGQLAMAIQEAQAYDNERRQAERINAMSEASRAVVSILDINDLLDEVVDLISDYFGYDRVHLFLRSGNRVVFRSGSGVHSAKWAIEHLSYDLKDNGFIAWSARSGQALVSGDVQHDERYAVGPGLEDSRSEMTVPISMGERTLGVFDIQSTLPNAFKPEDVTLVQALSDTVAIGLRNAGLFATETRRRVLAETLREVSNTLTSSLDLESVLDGILVGLERVVHYEAAMILLKREEEGHSVVSAVRGALNESRVLGELIPNDDTFADRMWDQLHLMELPEIVADTTQHDHLYAPLQVGGKETGKEIGTLAVDRFGPDHFSPEDVEIINTFASQAAVAIANAQLYMAQKEEAWVSTALLQVAEATSRSTSLDEVLTTVAQITPLLAGVEWCAVFLADNKMFRVVEIEGVDPKIIQKLKGHVFHYSEWAPFVKLCEEGKPVLITPDMEQPTSMPIKLKWTGQAVLLPLFAKGEVSGALLIGQQEGAETEFLTDRKIELVSGIANQAALAIEGAQLVAAVQEEAWVTTALLQVAESVNSINGLDQTLETLVRITPMLVGVTRCGIMHWEAASQHFVGATSWGLPSQAMPKFAGLVLSADSSDFVHQLATANEPLVAGDESGLPVPPTLSTLFDVPALLGLPLVAKGTLVGAMLVDHAAVGTTINSRRMSILIGIAHQSALAMETSRLQTESIERQRLERELEVARGIQHSFLPERLPNVPGWDLAARYRAARQVGGDFYDFIPLRSGKWGIVIADVADKGVPAALFMALSRTNIRAAAFNRDSPAETLVRVNELILSDSRSDLFVTVWYGVWNPTTGEIVYASCGHNPPLVILANNKYQELSAHGIALGVIDTIHLEEKRIVLQPGDVLLAYTDGVTDAPRSDGVEFGVSGLKSVATNLRLCSAQDISKGVIEAVDQFTIGEPQFDDLTLIVLKNVNQVAPTDALNEDKLTQLEE